MEIKVGDLVTHRGGGPKMTVQVLSDYSYDGGPEDGAKCAWFVCDEIKEHVFAVSSLVKCEEDDS